MSAASPAPVVTDEQLAELLRDAQAGVADRAPRLELILAGLPERDRRRRARRRTRVGAAAVVVAAVGAAVVAVPALRTHPAAPHPTAGPSASPPVPAPAPLLLRWSPTWLPAAYQENSRTVTVTDGVPVGSTRVWTTAPAGPTVAPPGIELVVAPSLMDLDQLGTGVDIKGMSGRYVPTPHAASVRWNVDSNRSISVTAWHVTVSESNLLRVARSVVEDGAGMVAPLTVAGLPTGFLPTSYRQGPTFREARAALGDEQIDVLTSPVSPAPGTAPWTDGTGTAWRSVVRDLPDGRGRLTVSGTAGVDEQALLNVAKLFPRQAAALPWP